MVMVEKIIGLTKEAWKICTDEPSMNNQKAKKILLVV